VPTPATVSEAPSFDVRSGSAGDGSDPPIDRVEIANSLVINAAMLEP